MKQGNQDREVALERVEPTAQQAHRRLALDQRHCRIPGDRPRLGVRHPNSSERRSDVAGTTMIFEPHPARVHAILQRRQHDEMTPRHGRAHRGSDQRKQGVQRRARGQGRPAQVCGQRSVHGAGIAVAEQVRKNFRGIPRSRGDDRGAQPRIVGRGRRHAGQPLRSRGRVVPLAQRKRELRAHTQIGIGRERRHLRIEGRRGTQKTLGKPQGEAPDAGIRILQRPCHPLDRQTLECREQRQRLQTNRGRDTRFSDTFQPRDHARCAAKKQLALDPVASRSIGRIERGDQRGQIEFREVGNRTQRGARTHHAEDPAQVVAGAHRQIPQPFGRNPVRVLDHRPRHVDDPERSVGSGSGLHGGEPARCRREELRGLLVRRPLAPEGGAVGGQLDPRDDAMRRFADEGVAVEGFAEQRVTIDSESARRRHLVRVGRLIESLHRVRDRKESGARSSAGKLHDGRRDRDVGIAPRVTLREREVEQQVPRGRAEPVVSVVPHAAILRASCHRLDHTGVRLKAEILAADVDLPIGVRRTVDDATAEAVGRINPMVEPEREAVDPRLVVLGVETREHLSDHVRSTVAIGILTVENVRCGADQSALSPRQNARGKRNAVHEHRGLIVATVAIRIGEHPDPSARFPFSIDALWVVAHLDDPQTPVGAEFDRDRIQYQRFGCDELHGEARPGPQRGERLLRRGRARQRIRPRRGEVVMGHHLMDGADDPFLDLRREGSR